MTGLSEELTTLCIDVYDNEQLVQLITFDLSGDIMWRTTQPLGDIIDRSSIVSKSPDGVAVVSTLSKSECKEIVWSKFDKSASLVNMSSRLPAKGIELSAHALLSYDSNVLFLAGKAERLQQSSSYSQRAMFDRKFLYGRDL